MKTNEKNREKVKNFDYQKNKQIKTGYKNGRYSGTKERFTGWMFNKNHPEMKKEIYHKKNIKKFHPYSDFNNKVRAHKANCCKIFVNKKKK